MLRGCTPASMLQTMVAAGHNETVAAQGISDVAASPILQAARNHHMTANNEALKTGPLADLVHDVGTLPGYLDPSRATVVDAVVEPGEAIFLPLAW